MAPIDCTSKQKDAQSMKQSGGGKKNEDTTGKNGESAAIKRASKRLTLDNSVWC